MPCRGQQGSGWLSADEDTSLVIPDLGPDGRTPDGEGRESPSRHLLYSHCRKGFSVCHPQGLPHGPPNNSLTCLLPPHLSTHEETQPRTRYVQAGAGVNRPPGDPIMGMSRDSLGTPTLMIALLSSISVSVTSTWFSSTTFCSTMRKVPISL